MKYPQEHLNSSTYFSYNINSHFRGEPALHNRPQFVRKKEPIKITGTSYTRYSLIVTHPPVSKFCRELKSTNLNLEKNTIIIY